MRRGLNLLAFAAVALVIAVPVFGADNGFYLGGSVGSAAVNSGEAFQSVSFNSNETAWKGFLGFRFLHFIAVEGAYADLGSATSRTNGIESSAHIKVYHGEAVGLLPLGILDIFAKAGVASWKTNFSGGASGNPSQSGTDPVYGGGVQFRIQSWAIRGEVELFDIKNSKHIYMYSAGGSYTF